MSTIIFFKGKVVTVLKHHTTMPYGEVEVKLHTFLITALDKDKWSASHSGHFMSE